MVFQHFCNIFNSDWIDAGFALQKVLGAPTAIHFLLTSLETCLFDGMSTCWTYIVQNASVNGWLGKIVHLWSGLKVFFWNFSDSEIIMLFW